MNLFDTIAMVVLILALFFISIQLGVRIERSESVCVPVKEYRQYVDTDRRCIFLPVASEDYVGVPPGVWLCDNEEVVVDMTGVRTP